MKPGRSGYNTRNKRHEKYCPTHFGIIARYALVQQIKLRNYILQQEEIRQYQLQEERKRQRYYIKPLFEWLPLMNISSLLHHYISPQSLSHHKLYTMYGACITVAAHHRKINPNGKYRLAIHSIASRLTKLKWSPFYENYIPYLPLPSSWQLPMLSHFGWCLQTHLPVFGAHLISFSL